MDIREQNQEYAEIGEKLIQNEPIFEHIKESEATIGYLSSSHAKTNKGKKVLGQCERIQDKYKWAIPCDFTITLFEPNLEGLTEEQIEIVIFHELLHVGIERLGDGTELYSILPHDLEDFKEVIDRYGTEWADVKGV